MYNLMIDALKTDLIKHVLWTNDYADMSDINRNHVNYGETTAYANVLRKFGVDVDITVYGEGEFLRIPELVIDARVIKFEHR